jgi:hypothetical protein
MVVVAAAFPAHVAGDAARELATLPDVSPGDIARAPLGAVGRPSDGKILVAVRITDSAIDDVARIVDQYGGTIVTRATDPDRVLQGAAQSAEARSGQATGSDSGSHSIH